MRWWCNPLPAGKARAHAHALALATMSNDDYNHACNLLIAAANAMGTHLRAAVLGTVERVAQALPCSQREQVQEQVQVQLQLQVPVQVNANSSGTESSVLHVSSAGIDASVSNIQANKEEVQRAAQYWLLLAQSADDALTPPISASDIGSALLSTTAEGLDIATSAGGGGGAVQQCVFSCDVNAFLTHKGTNPVSTRVGNGAGAGAGSGSGNRSTNSSSSGLRATPVQTLQRIGKLAGVQREPILPSCQAQVKLQKQKEKENQKQNQRAAVDTSADFTNPAAILSTATAARLESTCNEAIANSKRKISDILDSIYDPRTGAKRVGVNLHAVDGVAQALHHELHVQGDVAETLAVLQALPRSNYFYEKCAHL